MRYCLTPNACRSIISEERSDPFHTMPVNPEPWTLHEIIQEYPDDTCIIRNYYTRNYYLVEIMDIIEISILPGESIDLSKINQQEPDEIINKDNILKILEQEDKTAEDKILDLHDFLTN